MGRLGFLERPEIREGTGEVVAVLAHERASEKDFRRRIEAGPVPQRRFRISHIARIALGGRELEVAARYQGGELGIPRRLQQPGAQLPELGHRWVAGLAGQSLQHRRVIRWDVGRSYGKNGWQDEQECDATHYFILKTIPYHVRQPKRTSSVVLHVAGVSGCRPVFEHTNEEKPVKKLMTVIVTAMFAVASASVFAASHAGGAMDKGDKMEKKGKMEKKKHERKKGGKKMDKMEKKSDAGDKK